MPGIGRFASADTIVPNPASPQSFNRYSYVLNSPLNFTDPTGHCATDDDECNSLADQIENDSGGLVQVNRCTTSPVADCIHWTTQELQLLWETHQDHILNWTFDNLIIFIRVQGQDYEGLHSGFSNSDGSKFSEIRVNDSAWTGGVGLGIQDSFYWQSEEIYFQSLIAHELTHAAQLFHPESIDSWQETGMFQEPSLFVGLWYNWDNEYYANLSADEFAVVQTKEMMAMSVSLTMYDPTAHFIIDFSESVRNFFGNLSD